MMKFQENEASQILRESLQQSVSNKFGDYWVADQINHGAFGHVFKLIEIKTKRVYALKVLDKTKNGKSLQAKIKNQINIHQSLKNRYVLQLLNKFHDEMIYYMVLEYCEKGDLAKFIQTNYPNSNMPPQLLQKFASQIAKGISYLHKQDIIHGDIKANNILITQKDQIKICDFGLSTKRKNKQKVNGAKGTYQYLAPESLFSYDEKVDIWAFGVLLYFMATGTYPFKIQAFKHLTDVLTDQNLRKFQYPEKIDPKLQDLLKKIFVFDPVQRYSITEVLNHPFITGQDLNFVKPEQSKRQESVPRMRSHASTTIQCIKKSSDSAKMNYELMSKRSRPSSQNKDYEAKKTKQNYLGKILDKKTKIINTNTEIDKQNNMNVENTRKKQNKPSDKVVKIQSFKTKEDLPRGIIQPLNTEGMVIKPIVEKNCVTKIDTQGICRLKEQTDEQNRKVLKEIKVSPDGKVILMKINKVQKFYRIENLPQKYHKQYQNCRKIVNSVKNHTAKLQFTKKIHHPIYKDIRLALMYSGKVIAQINGKKIETTEKQLQQDDVTFAQNREQFITQEESIKHEIKSIYQKLISL